MTLFSRLHSLKIQRFLPGLDALAILAWGALLFRYSVSGQLKLLIHPNYFWLVFLTSVILLVLGGFKIWQWGKDWRNQGTETAVRETVQHITLLPPGWATGLLLMTAIAGFLITPTVLSSQVALQRGISASLPVTSLQPQAFRATIKPENRTLIDWIRTLNAYPEPDAYAGQKANVTGFVVHVNSLPDNYILLGRFIITCCAVDAYPVGLPVKLDRDRSAYPPDSWLQITGEMLTETLPLERQTLQETATDQRQLVLAAQSIKVIPTPADPYAYQE